MTASFGLTFDYRCPWARIVHDHVVTGLRGGADWDVTFLPFCLGQVHVEEGETDIWERPREDSGLLALQLGVSVRDRQPGKFLDVHEGLYNYRHAGFGSLTDEGALRGVLESAGADADDAFADVATGRPLSVVRAEHTGYADSHQVWGVPTFVKGDRAVFVRLLERPGGDAGTARTTVDRIIESIDWPVLNEFKHTSVPM